MNEQEQAELATLKERQLLLLDRLQAFGTELESKEAGLDSARRELESLKEQQSFLLEEREILQQQLLALAARVRAEESQLSQTSIQEIPPLVPTPLEPAPLEFRNVEPSSSHAAVPATPPVPPFVLPLPLPPVIETPAAPRHAPIPKRAAVPGSARAAAPPTLPDESAPVKKSSFEMRLGTFWLVRIGIIMLLTGMVFLGSFAYKNLIGKLGAGGKISLLYLLSGALLGVGAWLHRKQASLKNYAQVLIAGGLAAVYFTTYAAHHITALRVIDSAILDGALLLGWAAFMVWLADRIKSEVLALFAIGLAYYTSVMTDVGFFTLYSNLMLTVAAVFFLVRNRWATLSFISVVATYGGYAFWRFYHDGVWRWASPDAGLWSGSYFLMSYWITFTAAVFLSRSERLAGPGRASFLSLNNGAFFALFILTMFQVGHGGFWKFSLGYGAVLLALAVLAQRVLAEEKFATNAYLTQGLLLVTLGFLTYFTGPRLALVLAAESVVLTVLGRQTGNRLLSFGSCLAAALAAGWGMATITAFDRPDLLLGIAIGALLVFNSYWDRLPQAGPDDALRPRRIYFAGLGLAIWFLITWQNSRPEWRGLALAMEGTVLLIGGQLTKNPGLRWGAYPFAFMAVIGSALNQISQFNVVVPAERIGLLPGVVVGALLVVSAWWERRRSEAPADKNLQPQATVLSALALIVWACMTWTFAPLEYRAPILAIEALLFTAAFYPLRLMELTLLGQSFLALAQIQCLGSFLPKEIATTDWNQARLPWWNPVVVIGTAVALSHWWQRQQSLVCAKETRQAFQGAGAIATVAVVFLWLKPTMTAPAWLAVTSLLAIGATAYGVLTRAWFLAAFGQLFLLASGFEFVRQIVFDSTQPRPLWIFALAPVAALAGLSVVAMQWLEHKPEAKARFGGQINGISLAYRIAALLISIGWIFEYIPARERFWVFLLVGALFFLGSGFKKSRQSQVIGAAFALVGLLTFWWRFDDPILVYWPNFPAVLLLLGLQQTARRFPENYPLTDTVHTVMLLLGNCTLWLLSSRSLVVASGGAHFYLTAVWAGLALVIFGAGFVLRERIHRWFGLGVLACALARVAVSDVWRLETIYRILSFMALGVVLLVLGFIYNKYQEKIRQWL